MKRSLRLCLWCLAAAATEAALYESYRGHSASFHWFTHFFVGASAALVVMTAVAVRRRGPVPYPALWLLVGHLIAMAPDFLFAAGVVHRRWMDLFLGHVSSHFVPGRNVTWYLVFLTALGLYLAAIDRTSRA